MAVPFRFDNVLRVRETERDKCRLSLAQEQQREAALLAEHARISAERQTVLEELRRLHDRGDVAAERILTRRQHAEHLAADILRIDAILRDVSIAITRRRAELLEADTAVKALEKLAGRHHDEQRRIEQADDERNRDDARRTGRAA
jgi:flagellar biosynthesis chaperone FliJ